MSQVMMPGLWYHIVAVVEQHDLRLYVNGHGTSVYMKYALDIGSRPSLDIGPSESGALAEALQGSFADVRAYTWALPEALIWRWFTNASTFHCPLHRGRVCSGHGTCVPGPFMCHCDPPYRGRRCSDYEPLYPSPNHGMAECPADPVSGYWQGKGCPTCAKVCIDPTSDSSHVNPQTRVPFPNRTPTIFFCCTK